MLEVVEIEAACIERRGITAVAGLTVPSRQYEGFARSWGTGANAPRSAIAVLDRVVENIFELDEIREVNLRGRRGREVSGKRMR